MSNGMTIEQLRRRDVPEARQLIEAAGLVFEADFDELVGVYAGGELVATAARQANILKMLAIRPEHQHGSLLGELATELIRLGFQAGYDSFFIFTAPANLTSFEALNFQLLACNDQAALLEYGGGLQRYLQQHRQLVRPGRNGAVVVNCNPFTLGHRYLIETAAAQVDNLYVFVVREDRSVFPFEVRMRLVCEGVADLPNVVPLDSSRYAVSAVTFPAYFLKKSDGAGRAQMELDLELFARHLAPFFHVRRRFIGTEPFCRTTRLYSEAMTRILPRHGVEAVQLERRRHDGEAISAYRVRAALRQEAFETVRRLVPPSTLDFLLSAEAEELRAKLRQHDGRH